MQPRDSSVTPALVRRQAMSRYLSRFKGLLQDDPDRSWRSWAAQKLQRKPCPENEFLTLFPGWAARRYHHHPNSDADSFDIEAAVSGYASSCRANGQVTRSQRAFLRIAKGFAALPRIADQGTTPEEPFSDDLRVLEQQFRSTDTGADDLDAESPTSSFLTAPPRQINTPLDVLQKLHCNLESRIQLFWSSSLSARTVRLHLFASPRDSFASDAQHRHAEDDAHRPIATIDVVTAVDGSFSARFRIPWQKLCQHHRGVYIAYGLPAEEHDLVIVAELLPPPVINTSVSTPNVTLQSTPNSHLKPSLSHTSSQSQSNIYLDVPPNPQSHPHLNTLLKTLSNSISLQSILMPSSTSLTHTTLPLTHSPIRVISDIDDTVKMSGITEGARAVFHNVFVKELKDGIIPGMGDWYTKMWERGVRFHYVSNGPFEYLPLLHEFFALSKLPPGSIKLKSYAGRSLLSGLLSAPAARKRAGVVEILDSFPDSKFVLIGDSGEQDLELYADLARDRPDQIIAVFIRDADEFSYAPVRDPTGWEMVGAGRAGTRLDTGPLLNYDYTSPPSSGASSPGLEFADITRNRGERQQQQQMTPRAKMLRRFSGEWRENMRRFTTPLRTDVQVFDEDPVEAPTPTQTSVPLFESPTITPSNSGFLGPPKPMMTMTPGIITTPPPPIHPLRLPQSGFSSSSPTLLSSSRGAAGSLRQDSWDRIRTVKTTSDLPPQGTATTATTTITTDRQVNDERHERTNLRTTIRNNTIGPSNPLSYTKPSSRLSLHGFGVGNWTGSSNDVNRRVVSGSSAPVTGGRRSNNGSIGESGSISSSSRSSSPSPATGGSTGRSEGEKKRGELQMRVYTARTQMPGGVVLRVFRSPEECREDVEMILGGEEVGV